MVNWISQGWKSHRAALVIAHPGHELRIHHWVELAQPLVLVLTDGSGHVGQSQRLRSTRAILRRAGARTGALYGRLTDRDLYQAILSGNAELFIGLADELSQILEREGVEYLVGDAVEGFNPGHDVVRLLLNAARLRILERRGRSLPNFEFSVEGHPDSCPEEDRAHAILLKLDDDAFERKIAAVMAYPGLDVDIARLLENHRALAFRDECLRPVKYDLQISHCFDHPAYYERYGKEKVAAGTYSQVIRFREHIAPIAEHLGIAALRHADRLVSVPA